MSVRLANRSGQIDKETAFNLQTKQNKKSKIKYKSLVVEGSRQRENLDNGCKQ